MPTPAPIEQQERGIMSRKRPTSWWPVAALTIGAVAVALIALWPTSMEPHPIPTPTHVPKALVSTPTPSAPLVAKTEPTPEPLVVPASDIVQVSIPSVTLKVLVSGETLPRVTERCKGAVQCIDPPVADQAAWYGAVPATQSTGTVRLFGHTSWNNPAYAAFNGLVSVKAGDTVTVETKTGIFTYRAETPQLVPYTKVAHSTLIWGDEPNRLVLVTCNNQEKSGTVVEAWLVKVVPR